MPRIEDLASLARWNNDTSEKTLRQSDNQQRKEDCQKFRMIHALDVKDL